MDLEGAFAELRACLSARDVTVAFAESCTGGLAGYLFSREPGASSCFMGSAVTYSNESKIAVLGVPPATLERHGAVSEETAVAMAHGARKAYGSDVAASITGIAGPGGGTEEKPVGTVWIAVTDGGCVSTSLNLFPGDRERVRRAAAERMALQILSVLGE